MTAERRRMTPLLDLADVASGVAVDRVLPLRHLRVRRMKLRSADLMESCS